MNYDILKLFNSSISFVISCSDMFLLESTNNISDVDTMGTRGNMFLK